MNILTRKCKFNLSSESLMLKIRMSTFRMFEFLTLGDDQANRFDNYNKLIIAMKCTVK